jgi:hypothetical protein
VVLNSLLTLLRESLETLVADDACLIAYIRDLPSRNERQFCRYGVWRPALAH